MGPEDSGLSIEAYIRWVQCTKNELFLLLFLVFFHLIGYFRVCVFWLTRFKFFWLCSLEGSQESVVLSGGRLLNLTLTPTSEAAMMERDNWVSRELHEEVQYHSEGSTTGNTLWVADLDLRKTGGGDMVPFRVLYEYTPPNKASTGSSTSPHPVSTAPMLVWARSPNGNPERDLQPKGYALVDGDGGAPSFPPQDVVRQGVHFEVDTPARNSSVYPFHGVCTNQCRRLYWCQCGCCRCKWQ